MKNSSLLKIILSLLIMGIYIFLFGMVGRVDGAASLPEETTTETEEVTDTTPPPETDPPETEITYSTTINVANAAKPGMADYEATETLPETVPEISEETEDIEEETTASEETTTTEETTTPQTTTLPPETTTDTMLLAEYESPADTTPEVSTEPPEETTVQDTTEPETTADTTTLPESSETTADRVTGEQLTVYYSGSGGNVTGNAADILAQVVMGEIGGNFNPEAIKAQAVAAYTYIKYYNSNDDVPYVAVRTPNQAVKDCVNEILGQAIYYNGELIQSVYGASTAGYTASSKTVWGVDYPYLQSRVCELDSMYDPNYGAKMTMTSGELKNLVYNNTGINLEGDPSTWIVIQNYVDNVFVGDMSLGGHSSYQKDGKTIDITGRKFREQILEFKLKSACFDVSYDAGTDTFTFTTYGYGHCVGLSQHGANALATYLGYDYKQIIEYYFPGTVIM